MTHKVRIGIVGLGFGAEFIPIYQAHPYADLVAVCQRSTEQLDRIADHFGVERRYCDFDEMLRDPDIDAVHINTPIGFHADHAVAALNAGKHVACTVPMAVTVEDCARVVDAQRRSGKQYMMMETAVYTREFLYAQELVRSGRLGRIQFLRGAHMQEMAGWPDYWRELPPMHYATHAVAPLLALAGAEADRVRCLGSGALCRDDGTGGPPFAVQSALFALRETDLAMEVTRSLRDVAREYIESFDVYGSSMSYEWQQLEGEDPIVFTGEDGERVQVPDFAGLLPEEIRPFTTSGVYDAVENRHLSFTQGSGHGGSHPHLAHEFVSAILEGRAPFPDAVTAANWTEAGICAQESAITGREVLLPTHGRARSAPASDSQAALEVHLEPDGASIVRVGGGLVLRQHVGDGQRPYIHPLQSAGAGTVTEDAPAHHPWQHGLYVGLNDVNGVGFWTEGLHPKRQGGDGSFDSRFASFPVTEEGIARWRVETDYRDLDGLVMLSDLQAWRVAAFVDRLELDMTWTLKAHRDLVFGEYEYGGLFLRMPFRSGVGGQAVDSEGQSTSGHRARWVAVSMPMPATGREALVAVLDHPSNPGSPVPWRIDNELGVGPSPSAAGAWSLGVGQQTSFRYRLVVVEGSLDAMLVESAWERYAREEAR